MSICLRSSDYLYDVTWWSDHVISFTNNAFLSFLFSIDTHTHNHTHTHTQPHTHTTTHTHNHTHTHIYIYTCLVSRNNPKSRVTVTTRSNDKTLLQDILEILKRTLHRMRYSRRQSFCKHSNVTLIHANAI